MAQQVLDAHFQCQSRRGATGTSAFHMQINNAPIKAMKGDIAAILRHSRADARV